MRRFARPTMRRKKKAKKKTSSATVIERVTKIEKSPHIYRAHEWESGDRVHKITLLQIVVGKKKREFKALYSVKIFPTHIVVESMKGMNYTTKVIPLTGEEEIIVKEWQGYTWEKP